MKTAANGWGAMVSEPRTLTSVLPFKRKHGLLPHNSVRLTPTSSFFYRVRRRAGVREAQIRKCTPGICLL